MGARGYTGINALMTPIFKTSEPGSSNNVMALTLNGGKPVSFGRRASIGAALKQNAEERDGMPVIEGKKHKVTDNLMTPVFGCGVPLNAAQAN